MAIHTALSVLRPGKSMGLSRYRYVAYACWAGCSILLAGLAFINEGDAYISQGTFCYLPVRPIWYRLVLSWIPRYLILTAIVAIYLTIYMYTKSEFGKVDIDLISSTMSKRTSNYPPSSSISPDRSSSSRRWFGLPSKQRRSTSVGRPTSSEHIPVVSQQGPSDLSPKPPSRQQTLLEALRDKSFLPPRNDRKPRDTNHNLRKRHKVIKCQLRYMFIYPLVYAVMWFPPFINHCYFYTKEYNPPFALKCLSLVSLSLQCAVDCVIFGIREKPWRNGVGGHTRSKSKQSFGKGGEIEMGALAGGMEGAAAPDHAIAVEGVTLRPERNWWDNEPM